MSAPHPHPRFLRDFGQTRGYTLGRPSRVRLTPGGQAALYLRSDARSTAHDLFALLVDGPGGSPQERLLMRAGDLLQGGQELVSPEEQARRERLRITDTGFTELELHPGGALVLLPLSGGFHLLDWPGGRVRRLPGPAGERPLQAGRFSPDGRWLAFVAGGDLFILDLLDDHARPLALTEGGSDDRFFALPEFVAQEEMGRHEGYWWAPDGRHLAYAEVDQRAVEGFAIADPAHPQRPPQQFRYPRPGRANARVGLWLTAALDGDQPAGPPLPVRWDQDRFPYLARVLWDAPAAPLCLLVQTRDQREVVLLAADPSNGATRPLLTERDADWVNLERDLPRWLPDGSGLLWASEPAAGGRTLALHPREGGTPRPLLGPGEGFLQLLHINADSRRLKVLLGDAVHSRIEDLDLAGGARRPITDRLWAQPGEHGGIFSADGQTAVISRTTIDALPETWLVREGGLAPPLRLMLPARADDPPFAARVQLLRIRPPADPEGPEWNAAIIRPADFVPGRRYPVVLHVYGGPHSLMVKADQRAYLLDQWLADHGLVVVTLDNRGTPRRGRAWERVLKGQLGDLPLADQVAGLQALAGQFPELDLHRVGIYGWSFGGYLSALAVLRRPDLFRVAVAGAPVVDWRDYDTHYTERYLDLPQQAGPAYHQASLLTHAAGLSRPLLLVHGTADDNVYFFHSLKLAQALLGAGRPFDFLPLPGVSHQLADPQLRERVWQRMVDYLLLHLLPEAAS